MKPDEKKEEKKKRPWKFRAFVAVTAPLAAFSYYRYTVRQEAIQHAQETVIATEEEEIRDLHQRCKLNTTHLERMRDHLQRTIPSGFVAPDALAAFVRDFVEQMKQNEAAERKARLAARAEAEKQWARAEAQRMRAANQPLDGVTASEDDQKAFEKRERLDLEDDVDKWEEEYKKNRFKKERWDFSDSLIFCRRAPLYQQQLEVREFLIGLALLAQDEKPEGQRVVDPKLDKRELELKNALPGTKLDFAWRVTDWDNDGCAIVCSLRVSASVCSAAFCRILSWCTCWSGCSAPVTSRRRRRSSSRRSGRPRSGCSRPTSSQRACSKTWGAIPLRRLRRVCGSRSCAPS